MGSRKSEGGGKEKKRRELNSFQSSFRGGV